MTKALMILSVILIWAIGNIALAACKSPFSGLEAIKSDVSIYFNNPSPGSPYEFDVICDTNTQIAIDQDRSTAWLLFIPSILHSYQISPSNIILTYDLQIRPYGRFGILLPPIYHARYNYATADGQTRTMIERVFIGAPGNTLNIAQGTRFKISITNPIMNITVGSSVIGSPPQIPLVSQAVLHELGGGFSFTQLFILINPPAATCVANSFDVSVSDKEISFDEISDKDLNDGKVFFRNFNINVLRKKNQGCDGLVVEPILRLNAANSSSTTADIPIADSGLLLRITDDKGIRIPLNTNISMGETTDSNNSTGLNFRAAILKNNALKNIRVGFFKQVIQYSIIYR